MRARDVPAKWFAHQWAEIKPDVMTLAKGLAGGVPVGARGWWQQSQYLHARQPWFYFRWQSSGDACGIETRALSKMKILLENAYNVGKLKKDLSKSLKRLLRRSGNQRKRLYARCSTSTVMHMICWNQL